MNPTIERRLQCLVDDAIKMLEKATQLRLDIRDIHNDELLMRLADLQNRIRYMDHYQEETINRVRAGIYELKRTG